MSDDDFMLEDEEEVVCANEYRAALANVHLQIQDYDFDYEDDEEEEPDVDLENKYYNAKGSDTHTMFCWDNTVQSMTKPCL